MNFMYQYIVNYVYTKLPYKPSLSALINYQLGVIRFTFSDSTVYLLSHKYTLKDYFVTRQELGPMIPTCLFVCLGLLMILQFLYVSLGAETELVMMTGSSCYWQKKSRGRGTFPGPPTGTRSRKGDGYVQKQPAFSSVFTLAKCRHGEIQPLGHTHLCLDVF